MTSRRKFIAGASTVGLTSIAGCITANSEVADNYSRGYELYNTAKDDTSTDYEEVASLYERSAGYFETAEKAADSDTVKDYCHDSHKLATLDAETARAEAKAKAAAEKEEDSDEDGMKTYDSSEYENYLEKARNAQLKSNYEMKSPSTVKRRTRLPF